MHRLLQQRNTSQWHRIPDKYSCPYVLLNSVILLRVCLSLSEFPVHWKTIDTDANTSSSSRRSNVLEKDDGTVSSSDGEELSRSVPRDLIHFVTKLFFTNNSKAKIRVGDDWGKKLYLDDFTSIKVIRSSLFPTATVVPSGDQAKLIFSPRNSPTSASSRQIDRWKLPFVSMVVWDRSVLVSKIFTRRSALAVATELVTEGCQASWLISSPCSRYVRSLV